MRRVGTKDETPDASLFNRLAQRYWNPKKSSER